jgi:hypothetical protein
MSADKNLMDVLADARPRGLDPAVRPDPAAIMAHSRLPESATSVRRPVRRLVLAGAVPAVAVVAAVAAFLGTQGATPERGGQVTAESAVPVPASARELLLVAAERSGSATADAGRYQVITEERGEVRPVGPAGRRYDIVRRTAFERWYPTAPGGTVTEFYQSLGAKPVTAEDTAAWRADGSPAEWVEQPPKDLPDAEPVTIRGTAGERGYAQIPERESALVGWYDAARLPTDPGALRQSLLEQRRTYSGENLSDFELFRTGVGIALNLRLSPEVRAAAFRMLADMDGVTNLGQVKDQKNRAGVAVGYARKGDSGHWSQIRVIIEPGTGQPLADESWDLGADKKGAGKKGAGKKGGELLSYHLVIGSRYTDDAPPIESAKPRGGK